MNKLRVNWFHNVLCNCWGAIKFLIDDPNLKNKLKQKADNLSEEVGSTVEEQGETNRKLVEKAEALMKEIKGYL
jgi:hypothetical protein